MIKPYQNLLHAPNPSFSGPAVALHLTDVFAVLLTVTLCSLSSAESLRLPLPSIHQAFGLPGLRIGWLAARPACYPIINRVAEIKDYTTICNSVPSEVRKKMMALSPIYSWLAAWHLECGYLPEP